MTEMERRVADAIARHIDMSGIIPLDAARAAIAAMRDVTKEMVYAGDTALDACQDSDFSSDADGNRSDYTTIKSDAPSIIWRAMIDAALSEGLPTADK